MANAKEIRARIKSVKNTGKITKAMELISTVKMKKAQEGVFSTRPFALSALQVLLAVGNITTELSQPSQTEKLKELVVVITSNKGLCGGYNVNVLKQTAKFTKEQEGTVEFVSIGKKAKEFVQRSGGEIMADFSADVGDVIDIKLSKKISRTLIGLYKSGAYAKISVIYGHYVSAIMQKPVVKTFLPIIHDDIVEFLQNIAGQTAQTKQVPFTMEPNRETIITETLPMILDALMYEMLLEAKASEHASRMVAMKNAKDSANKKVTALTLGYNKARQAGITREITEIVSGVESMKD